jgi:hypothetical protein
VHNRQSGKFDEMFNGPLRKFKMKKTSVLIIIVSGVLSGICGCDSSNNTFTTGFLSDYSNLKPASGTSRRYLNPKFSVKDYTKFIVEPVELYLEDNTKAQVGSGDELAKLKAYMHEAIINTLEPRYAAIGTSPGPKTARIRIAITNVKKGSALGLGSASIEAEFIDSQTGEQIAAFIESQQKRRAFGAFSEWDDAKAAMDDWAQRLYNRLEESRY